jgi:hypothetical protein
MHLPLFVLLATDKQTDNLKCLFLLFCRYGAWEQLLTQTPPPRDARGVTAYGGPQFASVVYHAGRFVFLLHLLALPFITLVQHR